MPEWDKCQQRRRTTTGCVSILASDASISELSERVQALLGIPKGSRSSTFGRFEQHVAGLSNGARITQRMGRKVGSTYYDQRRCLAAARADA